MEGTRYRLATTLCACAVLLSACFDDVQSPATRSDGRSVPGTGGSTLGPIDLVYVCGNKFLLTNSTPAAVKIEYRVAGADESGSVTLVEGPGVDPGFSETELETINRGVVELYQDGERVARRANGGSFCGPAPVSALIAGASAVEAGSWEAPFPWPVVALHLHLLPDGKVLSWGRIGHPQVWNPATGVFTEVASQPELFCSGHAFLPDGRLLVSGGHISDDHGLPDNTIFTPGAQSWSRSTPMRRGRWYPTNTMLASGDVVIMAGRDEAGALVAEPEVWSSGAVRVLSTASLDLPYYPRTFLAPNGQIFYAGELQRTRYLDPSGTGSWNFVADRIYGVRDYGAAVMYEPGKILYVGGGRVTNTAEVIDLNSAAPAWQATGSMAYPRRHLNATLLPNGEVLVTGGSRGTAFNDVPLAVHAAELWNRSTGIWTTLASNIVRRTYHATSLLLPDGRVLHTGSGDNGSPDERNAELFSPPYLFRGVRPTISAAPSQVRYGTTFSIATPDADQIAKVSLIRLGSTTHAFDMNQRFEWLSFTRGAGELTISVPSNRNRTPPGHYLLFILNGSNVPSVAKIVNVGDVSAPDPPPAASIVLSVATRTDTTKQYMTLTWTGAKGTMVDVYRNGPRLTTTENDGRYGNSRNFTEPATYVYQLCEAGTSVCSNEATATFGGGSPPPNGAPTANFTSSCNNLACIFNDTSTDGDGTVAAWAWNFGDGTTTTVRSPSHTYAVAGTYGVTLKVTDDDGATSQRSAQVTVTAPSSIPLTVTGRVDGTKQYMTLWWTGASGAMVDVYRNGPRLTTTENDGRYGNSRTFTGPATYVYKVCEAGTTTCSNEATVVFK
jgi:PKD repeat protein